MASNRKGSEPHTHSGQRIRRSVICRCCVLALPGSSPSRTSAVVSSGLCSSKICSFLCIINSQTMQFDSQNTDTMGAGVILSPANNPEATCPWKHYSPKQGPPTSLILPGTCGNVPARGDGEAENRWTRKQYESEKTHLQSAAVISNSKSACANFSGPCNDIDVKENVKQSYFPSVRATIYH